MGCSSKLGCILGKKMNISEPQVLLGKITALREKLEKAVREPISNSLMSEKGLEFFARKNRLASKLEDADECNSLIIDESKSPQTPRLPVQLTSKARELLIHGKELIGELRNLANAFLLYRTDDEIASKKGTQESGALLKLYRETTAMADTALRMIPNFPESPSSQLQLCAGVEAIFQVISQRLRILKQACTSKEKELQKISKLVDIFEIILSGSKPDFLGVQIIVEDILEEVRNGETLRFLREDVDYPARYVACKGLNFARVVARVIFQDAQLRIASMEIIAAALFLDIGMIKIQESGLVEPERIHGKLSRAYESHCFIGAELLRESFPQKPLLAEAALSHHENIDGTGFPSGFKGAEISPVIRFLAVCERYISRCMSSSIDKPLNTKSALTSVLMDSEDGKLDKVYARFLLAVSFYPSGTAVELSDGSLGVVLANPLSRFTEIESNNQIVAVLRETDGSYLPKPKILDLAGKTSPAVLRCLSQNEKDDLIGSEFPEWNSH
ncbi:MAG: hypothetical protein EBT92_09345 [Planctomycetes bacterium]|nr:hypothetical protein [Planctomycetota bacterium]